MKRFWDKVDIKSENDCWEWKAYRTKRSGYGSFGIKYSVIAAHRVAWMLTNGEIPANLYVLHKCDNPPCVNPKHLFIGTQKDNMDDCASKKRNVQSKKTHCPSGHEYSGENLMINKYGQRICRTCSRKHIRNSYRKYKK